VREIQRTEVKWIFILQRKYNQAIRAGDERGSREALADITDMAEGAEGLTARTLARRILARTGGLTPAQDIAPQPAETHILDPYNATPV